MNLRMVLALIVVGALVAIGFIVTQGPAPLRRTAVDPAAEPAVQPQPGPPAGPAGAGAQAKASGEPKPIQPRSVARKGLPADPVMTGNCVLMLEVVDAESLKPVRTEVTLWRLDAPGNSAWTPGDQVQERKLAPNGAVRFEGLPPGKYRAICDQRREVGEDSRVITVERALTEERIAIHPPGKYRVYLKIHALDGQLVREAGIRRRGETRSLINATPEWLKPRKLRRAKGADSGSGSVSRSAPGDLDRGVTGLRRGWNAVATDQGFDLGLLEGNLHQWRRLYRFEVHPDGMSVITARIEGDFRGETIYAGLAVPIEPIKSRILLPDGRRADRARARIAITTEAIRDAGGDTFERLRSMPVKVRASRNGYHDLEFTCRPGEQPDPRTLRPRAPRDR